jgi:hypothetical protein
MATTGEERRKRRRIMPRTIPQVFMLIERAFRGS